MKKNILKIAVLSVAISFSACEKMIEVDPRQSIDAEDALTSPEAVTAATNGVYARLRNVDLYGRDLIAIPELLADNAVNTGAGNRLVREANNEAGYHLTNWRYSYYGINQINLILEALKEQDFDKDFKNNVRGQNLFLRALFYHNLLKVYAYDPTAIISAANRGGVPILLNGVTAVEQIEFASRASIEDGYKLIYEDLTEAYTLLSNTPKSRAPYFITQGAVAALFSRVALYNGDYEKVVSEAEKAFGSGIASFPNSAQLVASWRSEKQPESFFEILFATPDNVGSNESLRATFMTRTTVESTNTASFGNVVLSDDLLSKFSSDDLRRNFIMKGLGANANLYEINKFASKNGVPNLDNVPVIRYAEVILNKAEAHANLNQPDLANTELNKIRTRAGLSAVSLSDGDLLEEILLQRRIELAFEGHRFFDLKRLGRNIIKDSGNVDFDDYRILARIPVREVEINPNLEQNRDY